MGLDSEALLNAFASKIDPEEDSYLTTAYEAAERQTWTTTYNTVKYVADMETIPSSTFFQIKANWPMVFFIPSLMLSYEIYDMLYPENFRASVFFLFTAIVFLIGVLAYNRAMFYLRKRTLLSDIGSPRGLEKRILDRLLTIGKFTFSENETGINKQNFHLRFYRWAARKFGRRPIQTLIVECIDWIIPSYLLVIAFGASADYLIAEYFGSFGNFLSYLYKLLPIL